MNKVILMGRLTRDPEVRYSQDGDSKKNVARYSLAVDRPQSRQQQGGDVTADFINCVTFGRGAEFAGQYLHKGTKILIEGRIQTGSYTNREGNKVYTTDVIVDHHEFAESKRASDGNQGMQQDYGNGNYGNNQYGNNQASYGGMGDMDGFSVLDGELPFR